MMVIFETMWQCRGVWEGASNGSLSNRRLFVRLPVHPSVRLSVRLSVCLSRFRVRSISPKPFERLSSNFGQMFTSVRRRAELMNQPRRFKVKVTFQGRMFEP